MTSVLVLDDRPADRELLATVLRYAGYDVQEASTGGEALELARAKHPDLVTSDVVMPGMDGYEFVRRLRDDPAIGQIPVVFTAISYDEAQVRSAGEAQGVNHFLVKPSEPAQVLRVVEAALGSGEGSVEATVAELFGREQLSSLNEKLVLKVDELEIANRQQTELQTLLREAENGAAESLTVLETLQSTAPIGIGFVDPGLRVVRMNGTLAAVSGLPLEEQLGQQLPDLLPELWPQLEPVFRQVLGSSKAVVNLELEGLSPEEGQQVHFWLGSYYPVSVDDEVIGVGIVLADVTDLKQAEDFRSVVMENMAEGLYAVDHEGRLAFMNAPASKMLGWTEEELRGKPMHDAIHHQHADGSPQPAEDCESCSGARVRGRTIRNDEDAYTRKDGSIFPVSSSAAPLLTGTSIRGAVVVFRDTTEESEERHRRQRELDALTWIGRIRDALDEDRLVLYSQPIVPLNGGDPSEELLLRLLDRSGEAVPPGSFLPVAEKYGLIGEIDKWVVSKAIDLAATSGRRIEANLSAYSISNLDLLSSMDAGFRRTGADPANLVFEITETALMQNLEAGEAFARGLTDFGCGLALDDFGTGFGSFTYLKSLPISYLKMDIDFVRDLPSNPSNRHLVKATVGLAQDFGHETIAEGVEDAETLDLLSEFGVDFAQGFHLGRPAPLEST